jgi:hypothetical protein
MFWINVEKNQKAHSVFNNEIMWENMVEPDRPQVTIRRMRFACWTTKATHTHTHTEHLINIASSRTMVTRMRLCIMLHVQYLSGFLQFPSDLDKNSGPDVLKNVLNDYTGLRLKYFFEKLISSSCIFVCWNTKWHSGLSWAIFFTKSNVNTVLMCTVHTVHTYKTAQQCHNVNSIYISTEGVFLLCEGYMELAPLVEIFCTNTAVKNKPRRVSLYFFMLKACSQCSFILSP